jgi:hypothetical protein
MKKTIYLVMLLVGFAGVSVRAQDPVPQDGQTQVVQPAMDQPQMAQPQMVQPETVQPQTVQPQPSTPQGGAANSQNPQNWGRGHRTYFPGTVVDSRPDEALPSAPSSDSGHRKAGIGSLADNVNQCDVDYGNRLDAWRRQTVAETIQNALFWMGLVETGLVFLLLCYVAYLDREKRQRHIIAADIVCQLYNAWAYSDRKARAVIAKHNRWVRQLNEEYEASMREVRGELPSDPAPAFANAQLTQVTGAPEKRALDEGSAVYTIIPDTLIVSDQHAARMPVEAMDGDTPNKGASIPTFDSARYQMSETDVPFASVSGNAVDDVLARVNRNAAATAADSELQREKKRLEEKVRASEEQNRALRKMLNDQNEKKAADQESPFEQGGRA